MASETITLTDAVPAATDKIPAYSWYALGVLTLVYVLNFLDRTLIYILFTPIKAEMHFTDLQLALLGASSFAIFYTCLGIPFGRLADRAVRKNMIAGGLACWSLFSGLTGFAKGFWPMFFCRLMVGVGEATLGPAALSLLSDYFPPRMRATVQGIYSTGIAIGAGLAFLLGGWLGQNVGWRYAFYFLGFPGLVLAVVVFFLKERPRGSTEVAKVRYSSNDWKVLFRSIPMRYLILGYGFFGIASNNLGIWVPSFFNRAHGISLVTIGLFAGIGSIAIGVPVTIFGGYISDRLRRFGKGGRMLFSMWAALLSIPLWLLLLFNYNASLLLVLNSLLFGFALSWLGPAAADVHDIAGPHLRGLGIGIYFSTVNIFAYGFGANVIAKISDVLGVAVNPSVMRYSLLVCPIACGLAALMLWKGNRALQRTDGQAA